MRLLVDEMWPPALAEQLRDRDHDVAAVLERGDLAHQADEAVFEEALREERAVFTENVPDFLPLAANKLERGEHFFGLLLSSDQTYPRGHPRTLGRAVRALDRYMSAHPGGDELRNRIDWLPSA